MHSSNPLKDLVMSEPFEMDHVVVNIFYTLSKVIKGKAIEDQ
jgi:hypothetical protein